MMAQSCFSSLTAIPFYRYTAIRWRAHLGVTVIPQAICTHNGIRVIGSVLMVNRKKTSINIDPETWKEWTKFVIDQTGSSRKASDVLEFAIKEYMERHNAKVEKANI